MIKFWTTAAALVLCSTPALSSEFTDDVSDLFSDITESSSFNTSANELQVGAGVGLVDMGLDSSGILFYGLAEKALDVDLDYFGKFDSAAQLRLGTSTAAVSKIPFAGDIKSNIDFVIAGAFKVHMDLQSNLRAYALAGVSYTSTSITTTALPIDISGSGFGLHYGLGADYSMGSNLRIAAEYASYSGAGGLSANLSLSF